MNQRVGYVKAPAGAPPCDEEEALLRANGCAMIYVDTASGNSSYGPELNRCLCTLGPGDTLVVAGLERISRRLTDLVQLMARLVQQEVCFVSLAENIETEKMTDRAGRSVIVGLAEFARKGSKARTRAGLAAARARGRAGGRKPKLDALQISEIERLMADPNISVNEIAERFNVSRTTIYKVAPIRGHAQNMTITNKTLEDRTNGAS